jgi:DNA replication factor GINS
MAPPLEPLTFEDVTKVYREEKKSAGLTTIRHDFYVAVRTFMDQLKRDYEKEAAADSYGTKARQLSQHIAKMREKVLQIFDMRAEKVMHMAVLAAAGGKLDHSRLTEEEKQLLEGALSKIGEMRNSLLDMPRPANMEFTRMSVMPMPSSSDEPRVKVEELAPVAESGQQAKPEVMAEEEPRQAVAPTSSFTSMQKEPIEVATPNIAPQTNEGIVILRILEDIPPFAGLGGTYRLGKEDVVTLPSGIGKALIKRGKAEEIIPS